MMIDFVANAELWGIIAGAALGFLIIMLISGSILESMLSEDSEAYNLMKKVMVAGAFIFVFIIATSFWPLAFQAILSFHQGLGISETFVSFLTRIRLPFILIMWGVQFIGLAIVLFYSWKTGLFFKMK